MINNYILYKPKIKKAQKKATSVSGKTLLKSHLKAFIVYHTSRICGNDSKNLLIELQKVLIFIRLFSISKVVSALAIIRTRKEEGSFVTISKSAVEDNSISAKAKGILLYMLSKPDDWIFYEVYIIKSFKCGRDAIRSGIKELIEAGYLKRQKKHNNGKISGYNYTVYESKSLNVKNTTLRNSLGKSNIGEPNVGEPIVGKPDTSNNKLTNNELSKNELTNIKKTSCIDSEESKPAIESKSNNLTVIKHGEGSIPFEAAKHFRECVLGFNPNAKVPVNTVSGLEKWADTFRLIMERDERSIENIRTILEFIFQKDEFWCGVISSPSGLRRNWDKAWGKMLTQKPKTTKSKINKLKADKAFIEWMEE